MPKTRTRVEIHTMAENVGGWERVKQFLERLGATCEVSELPASTRSAAEAAAAIGCQVEQVAKSIFFAAALRTDPYRSSPAAAIASAKKRFKLRSANRSPKPTQISSAADTPHAVFKTTLAEWKRCTGRQVGDFKV